MSTAGREPLGAVLAALGDWLHRAGPPARHEARACLHRVITWPWPQDMHVAVTFCQLALRQGTITGGSQ
jgi:hypothetical protein